MLQHLIERLRRQKLDLEPLGGGLFEHVVYVVARGLIGSEYHHALAGLGIVRHRHDTRLSKLRPVIVREYVADRFNKFSDGVCGEGHFLKGIRFRG